jgi:tetratricopeptide (TPR) repeat protein
MGSTGNPMKTKKRSPKTKMKGEKHNVSSIDEDLAPILKAFELQDFELMQRRSEILLATPHVPAVYAKVRHFLGLSFLLQWKVTQALPHLRHAAHDLPKDPDVWDHLGVALNRAGYRSEAEDCYRNVFALNPNRADTFINAAKNCHRKGSRS